MNRQKLLPLAFSIATAFAAASAWLWVQLEEERARTAELSARLASLIPAPIPASDPAPVEPPAPAPTPPASLPAASAPASAAVSAPRDPEVLGTEWQDRQRRLLQDPRYVEEVKRQQRMAQAMHRDHATRVVGLSDAQFDAAVDLWAEREMAMHATRIQASDGSDTRAQRDAADRIYEDSLSKLLQEPLASRWKHYRDSLPTRMRVNNLRSQLTGADALRDDQFEPLIEAMEVEQSQLRQELRRRRGEIEAGQRSTTANWSDYQQREIELFTEAKKRVLSAASPILSSSQLKQLAAMYEQEIEGRRSNLRMNQLEQKIATSQQAPGPD
jgi:hypothetical protein